MKKWQLYMISIFLIVFVSFLYGFASFQNNTKKITDIEVIFDKEQGLFLNAEIVNKLLIESDKNLLKKEISKIDLYQIEKSLNTNPMMERAEVYYMPNGKLQVNVLQRLPYARVQNGSDSYYIDRHGKKMPLSKNYTARVPLVTGVDTEEKEKESFEIIKRIYEDDFYSKQIIGIHRKANGDYLLSTRIGKHKILFGKPNNIDKKLKKLHIFYKKQWGSETLSKYKLLNLKYDRQVVCSI
jgi:cell division protein FtsQ